MRIKIGSSEKVLFTGLKGIVVGYTPSDINNQKQAYAESFTKDGHEYIKQFIAEKEVSK